MSETKVFTEIDQRFQRIDHEATAAPPRSNMKISDDVRLAEQHSSANDIANTFAATVNVQCKGVAQTGPKNSRRR